MSDPVRDALSDEAIIHAILESRAHHATVAGDDELSLVISTGEIEVYRVAYRAGREALRADLAAANARADALLATIERMRVAALMSDWDDFNAAIDTARGEK